MKRNNLPFGPAALILAVVSASVADGVAAAGMQSGSGRSMPVNPYGIPQIEVYQDPGAQGPVGTAGEPGMARYGRPSRPGYSSPSSRRRGGAGFGSSRGFPSGYGPERGMSMGSQPHDRMGYPPSGMMGQDPMMGYAPGPMMEPGAQPDAAGGQGPMMGYPPAGVMGQGPVMGYPPGAMTDRKGQTEGMPEPGPMMGYPPASRMGQGPVGGYGAMPPMMQDPMQMMNERHSAMEQRIDRIESMLKEMLENQQRILSSR